VPGDKQLGAVRILVVILVFIIKLFCDFVLVKFSELNLLKVLQKWSDTSKSACLASVRLRVQSPEPPINK
jgi:hypothetical protein